jgi:hypothetical protein
MSFLTKRKRKRQKFDCKILIIQLELLTIRQKQFINKEIDSPLLIFPEGTVTSGKHILKFKKGAFHSLLPIKPLIINTNTSDVFQLSVGVINLSSHIFCTLFYLYHWVEITELPVFYPNDFMFENYSKAHPEILDKWEIYSEVAREILCECGGMEKSSATYRDNKEYSEYLMGRKNKIEDPKTK